MTQFSLHDLEKIIAQRADSGDSSSWTVKLMGKGIEKAAEKGINVSSEVAEYIIHRVTRGMSELTEILEQLDEASLREKRKITIPFVKQILSL